MSPRAAPPEATSKLAGIADRIRIAGGRVVVADSRVVESRGPGR